MTFEEFEKEKRDYINSLQYQTAEFIQQYMPLWKQIRYRDFRDLHEKIIEGKTLTKHETSLYLSMSNARETPEMHYKKINVALNWVTAMITAHNVFEDTILNASFVEDFQGKTPDYPKWPFEK